MKKNKIEERKKIMELVSIKSKGEENFFIENRFFIDIRDKHWKKVMVDYLKRMIKLIKNEKIKPEYIQ